jgi:thioredoxin reductase (NADPH)
MAEGEKEYPLVIIGAGPAGLAASIYASRYGIENIIIGSLLGGQVTETHLVDNYPGIEDVTGHELAGKMGKHARKYGTEIIPATVTQITKKETGFKLLLDNGKEMSAQAILLATGTKKRELGITGEDEFLGKGVSYCATCDGFFYKNKIVAVVGGNDSAAGAAVFLATVAKKVFLIYRKSQLRAEKYWQELIEKNSNIEIIYDTNLTEIKGTGKVEEIILDKKTGNENKLLVDGVFIEIGSDPKIDFAKELGIAIDPDGYIQVNQQGSTSVVGVWAAGDITNGSDKFRQIITAAAEGAIAARNIANYLKK